MVGAQAQPTFPVDVVIPVYNEAKNIAELLMSISGEQHISKIIIADNGSTDETVHVITSMRNNDPYLKDKVQVISCPDIKSSYYARNIGATFCEAQFIYFIDADCRYVKGCLSHLLYDIKDYDCVVGSASDIILGKKLLTNWLQTEKYIVRSASLLVRRFYFNCNPFDSNEKTGSDVKFIRQSNWVVSQFEILHLLTVGGVYKRAFRYGTGADWRVGRFHSLLFLVYLILGVTIKPFATLFLMVERILTTSYTKPKPLQRIINPFFDHLYALAFNLGIFISSLTNYRPR